LFWLADGRDRTLWRHTSAVMALTANVNRDPKNGRPFEPADFDPYSNDEKTHGDVIEVTPETVSEFKKAFKGF
jgi:hypothetical protein